MAIKSKQGRKWLLTINNPEKLGLRASEIPKRLEGHAISYYCFCEEIASTDTPHIHLFLYSKSPIRFTTLQKMFPGAHIDPAMGSCMENREYLRKEGKWEESDKAGTKIEGSFQEFGEIPLEKSKSLSDNQEIMERIRAGASVMEIIQEFPQKAMQIKNIKAIQMEYLSEQSKAEKRKVESIVVTAPKSFDSIGLIFDRHSFKEVCRITNYGKGKGISFDTYAGQKVLVFDNFNEQIPLEELITYMEDYPVTLPARYEDRVAAYKYVYLLTEKHLAELYRTTSLRNSGLVKKFLLLVDGIIVVDEDGVIVEGKADDKQ